MYTLSIAPKASLILNPFVDRFNEGGPFFMSLILICLILTIFFLLKAFISLSKNVSLSKKMMRLTSDAGLLGLVIGFLDQFMPAVIASNAQDEMVKFILAGMAVTQLIYMSEVGLIILRSSLPLKFSNLIAIFFMRSLISFPVLLIASMILI